MQNNYNRKINIHMILQIIFFIILVAADRFTKYLAVTFLKGQNAAVIIKDVLELRYLENTGAAFGIFKDMQWMFYIITAIIMIILIVVWISLNSKLKKYCQNDSAESFRPTTYKNITFLNYLFSALAAGAVGNLIDRVFQKYVVDFIYFRVIDFPIFNFADICVTVTAVLLIIFFIFIYKEDPEFNIFGKRK